MNVHVDFVVTKRVIGVPIQWKNSTQYQVSLTQNQVSAERGTGVQRHGATPIRVHSQPSFQQETVLKLGFTESKLTYTYYFFEDILAQLGGLFVAAMFVLMFFALAWAWHLSAKLSMMMKRKAMKNI